MNKLNINQAQEEIIEEFEVFDDWMDKYQMLIDLGGQLRPLAEQDKTEQHLIDGCQSRVWIKATTHDGCIHLEADSDALIVKGIVALLIRVLDGQTPQDILSTPLYFIERIGLQEHLSPTRANGLLAMIERIRTEAKNSLNA